MRWPRSWASSTATQSASTNSAIPTCPVRSSTSVVGGPSCGSGPKSSTGRPSRLQQVGLVPRGDRGTDRHRSGRLQGCLCIRAICFAPDIKDLPARRGLGCPRVDGKYRDGSCGSLPALAASTTLTWSRGTAGRGPRQGWAPCSGLGSPRAPG